MKSLIPCLICILLSSTSANLTFAAGDLGSQFTLEGTLYSDTVASVPLLESSVTLKLQILDPSKDCILYSETQTVNTSATGGDFRVRVGSATGHSKRTTSEDPGNSMAKVFQNSASIPSQGCASNPYVPQDGDTRYLKIIVRTSDGVEQILDPELEIDSVPRAMVANTLQGYSPNQLIIQDGVELTQSNLQNVFSATHYPRLQDLLSVPAANYLRSDSSSGVKIPSLNAHPTAPAVGSVWYHAGLDKMVYEGQSGPVVVGTSGGSVLSVSVSGLPLSVASASTTPQISIAQATAGTAGYLSSADWTSFNSRMSSIPAGSIAPADLNFAGSMATNTGLLVRDGTQFHNKTCSGNDTLIWSVANGWICSAVILTESDPQVGTITTNYIPKWDGTALTTSLINESGGFVGIGVASPTTKLDVAGNVKAFFYTGRSTTASTFDQISATDDRMSVVTFRRSRSDGTPFTYGAEGVLSLAGETFTNNTFADAAGINWGWENTQSNNTTDRDGFIGFTTVLDDGNSTAGGTERMRITSTGRVGIGTPSPAAPLHIYGYMGAGLTIDGSAAPTLAFRNNGGAERFTALLATSTNQGVVGSVTNDMTFRTPSGSIHFSTDGGINSLLTLKGSHGNVGIGTASPSAVFNVRSTSATDIFKLSSNGGDVMVDQWGNLSSPSAFFSKNGTFQGTADAGNGWNRLLIGSNVVYNQAADYYDLSTGAAFDRAAIEFVNGGGIRFISDFGDRSGAPTLNDASFGALTKMVIQPSGAVGIGTTSPTAHLDVAGHVGSSGATPSLVSCGTGPSISGTDTRGEFTTGTGLPTACTLTFATTYSTAPYCVLTPVGVNPNTQFWISAKSTSTFTVTFAAGLSSQKFNYFCVQ